MDISFEADIICTDGACGRPTSLIVNPITRQITHVVVRQEGWIDTQFMVPVDLIVDTNAHQITLRCSRKELLGLEPFQKIHYLGDDLTGLGYASESYMLLPYASPEAAMPLTWTEERIPAGELAFHRGAHVFATDGRIGRVDEFLIDQSDEHITHLVMREGHLWGEKDVTIPIAQIDHLTQDEVHLKLSKHEIALLPSVAIRRPWKNA